MSTWELVSLNEHGGFDSLTGSPAQMAWLASLGFPACDAGVSGVEGRATNSVPPTALVWRLGCAAERTADGDADPCGSTVVRRDTWALVRAAVFGCTSAGGGLLFGRLLLLWRLELLNGLPHLQPGTVSVSIHTGHRTSHSAHATVTSSP